MYILIYQLMELPGTTGGVSPPKDGAASSGKKRVEECRRRIPADFTALVTKELKQDAPADLTAYPAELYDSTRRHEPCRPCTSCRVSFPRSFLMRNGGAFGRVGGNGTIHFASMACRCECHPCETLAATPGFPPPRHFSTSCA